MKCRHPFKVSATLCLPACCLPFPPSSLVRQRKESQTCSLPKVYLAILVTPLSVTRPVSDTAPGQRLNTAGLVSVSCVATTSQPRLSKSRKTLAVPNIKLNK